MPRVHHVKNARKDNPVAKAGEPYYWWKFAFGAKQFSKTQPRQSRLHQGRKSEVMAAQETLADDLEAATCAEDVKNACDAAGEEFNRLGEEYNDSAENMPEGLQDGEQAENMRTMGESLQMQGDALTEQDFECPEDKEDYFDEDAGGDGIDYEAYNAAVEEWLETLKSESNDLSDEVEFMF